jgi:hypothetical protein
MTQEKRIAIRREKTRLQRERVAWKRAHPVEAETKRINDLLDRERRAIKRDDHVSAVAFRKEAKRARWEANIAARNRRAVIKNDTAQKKRRGFLAWIKDTFGTPSRRRNLAKARP